MESLIKLADPTFTMSAHATFDEVDTELVLGLLRAVGGVSEEILKSKGKADWEFIGELRTRLDRARSVLVFGDVIDDQDIEDEVEGVEA